VQFKVKHAIKQLASMANDLVLLNQGANPAAYRNPRAVTVGEVLEMGLGTRLGDAGTLPPELMAAPAAQQRIVVLGDMLQAALSACCFQWTPWLHGLGDPICQLAAQGQTARLIFQALDGPLIEAFARRVEPAGGQSGVAANDALAASTGELALWMARFIIAVHGGTLAVTSDQGARALEVVLPLAP
jgi:hypothetical protein